MATINFYDALGYGAQPLGSGYIFFQASSNPLYSIYSRGSNYDVFGFSGINGVTGATFSYELGGSWVLTDEFTFTSGTQIVAEVVDFRINTPRTDVLSPGLYSMLLLNGNDIIRGNKYADYLGGENGDDQLYGMGGNDILSGGAGTDTAIFRGRLSEYTIEINRVSGGATITDRQAARDDTDQLMNVERVQFGDLSLNLGVSEVANSIPEAALNRIADLYVAFFNRVPDADGMEFWIGAYRNGQTIEMIAESFYNAGVAFSNLTGYSADMTNQNFVVEVYHNVLARTVDGTDEGVKFWVAALTDGSKNRGDLVSEILDAAYGETFSDPSNEFHWVQKLLHNKLAVAKQVALDWGVNYNTSEDSITKGMAIAAAVTPEGISDAISLVGVSIAEVI